MRKWSEKPLKLSRTAHVSSAEDTSRRYHQMRPQQEGADQDSCTVRARPILWNRNTRGHLRDSPTSPPGSQPWDSATSREHPHPFQFQEGHESRGALASRLTPVIGAGQRSGLVAETSHHERSTTVQFLIEGIRRDATDSQVPNMVSQLVLRLHNLAQVTTYSEAVAGTKSYRIAVDAADVSEVLEAAHWPLGLKVSPWTDGMVQHQPFPSSTVPPASLRQPHQCRPGGGNGSYHEDCRAPQYSDGNSRRTAQRNERPIQVWSN